MKYHPSKWVSCSANESPRFPFSLPYDRLVCVLTQAAAAVLLTFDLLRGNLGSQFERGTPGRARALANRMVRCGSTQEDGGLEGLVQLSSRRPWSQCIGPKLGSQIASARDMQNTLFGGLSSECTTA